MRRPSEYSVRERLWLGVLAAVGLIGVNGVFLYALVFRRDMLVEAIANPVAVAFIAEALVLVGALAYLLRKWRVARLPWLWFVALALLGGLAFALPVVLLWPSKGAVPSSPPPAPPA
ncbi:MAG: hypothetical protein PVF27_00535 [Gemmatimonadales bacterium]|jgi:hypothetical protein